EAKPQFVRHHLDLDQVLAGFRTDIVDVLQRGARQLELPARLQADRGGIALGVLLLHGDDVAALLDRRPAEAGQTLQHGADARRAVIAGAAETVLQEAEFLVLGPDAPLSLGLHAFGQKTRHGLKRQRFGLVFGHVQAPLRRTRGPWRLDGRARAIAQALSVHGVVRASFQSPMTACHSVMAAMAAVSARSTRGPSDTGTANGRAS